MPKVTEWFLPASSEPLEKIAARATDGESRPVDIERLLCAEVPVEEIEWSQGVDALMMWSSGRPAKVLIKKVPSYSWRRRRMTMAHELGHVLVPWHVGYGIADCHDDEQQGQSGDIVDMEREAREIAGRILVPRAQLVEAASESDGLQAFFEMLDEFHVSPWAAAIRLTQTLRPGFAFRGYLSGGESEDTLVSPGTGKVNFDSLSSEAADSGTFVIANKTISWVLAEEGSKFVAVSDPRRPSDILKSIIADVYTTNSEDENLAHFYSFQGKIGGGLSKGTFDSVQAVYNQALQKAKTSIPSEVRAHPDWDIYLALTVENRASKSHLL